MERKATELEGGPLAVFVQLQKQLGRELTLAQAQALWQECRERLLKAGQADTVQAVERYSVGKLDTLERTDVNHVLVQLLAGPEYEWPGMADSRQAVARFHARMARGMNARGYAGVHGETAAELVGRSEAAAKAPPVKKVVINTCPGGFELSNEAVFLLWLQRFPLRADPLERAGMALKDFDLEHEAGCKASKSMPGYLLANGQVFSYPTREKHDALLRSHPVLVKVVEALGERASGPCAELRVEEIPADAAYRITARAGAERLEYQSDYTSGFSGTADDIPLDLLQRAMNWRA